MALRHMLAVIPLFIILVLVTHPSAATPQQKWSPTSSSVHVRRQVHHWDTIAPRGQTDRNNNGDVPESERDALLQFFETTYGSQWYHHDGWNTSASVCTWYGVRCKQSGSIMPAHHNAVDDQLHVTELRLTENNIVGTMPSGPNPLCGLTHLTWLDLGYSNIPSSLSHYCCLSHLLHLDMTDAALSGDIPACLTQLHHLKDLVISYNELEGSLRILDDLVTLKFLIFSGTFNDSLPSMTALRLHQFFLIGVKLPEGSGLPSGICQWTELAAITVTDTNLSGDLPPCLGELPSLTLLFITRNQFNGTLPPLTGANLTIVRIANNPIHGSIPPITNLPLLRELSLSNLAVSGSFPLMRNLPSLEEFGLHDNTLSGDIIFTEDIPSIRGFTVANNGFSGNLSFLDHLVGATSINLANNHFCYLDGSTLQLPKLHDLLLSGNPLEFHFDLNASMACPPLPHAPNLLALQLRNSSLQGHIARVFQCINQYSPSLVTLDMSINALELPVTSLGELCEPSVEWTTWLPSLRTLDLSFNRLRFMRAITYLRVPHGHYDGLCYFSFATMALQYLDIRGNFL
jgi:Leucine-rich repeat (LRR) protein